MPVIDKGKVFKSDVRYMPMLRTVDKNAEIVDERRRCFRYGSLSAKERCRPMKQKYGGMEK